MPVKNCHPLNSDDQSMGVLCKVMVPGRRGNKLKGYEQLQKPELTKKTRHRETNHPILQNKFED